MAARSSGDAGRDASGLADPFDEKLIGDPSDDQIALMKFGSGLGLYLPDKMRRRLSRGALRTAAVIQCAAVDRERLMQRIDAGVEELRGEHGVSWGTIGWLTNMTAAGARKRWGGDDEEPESD